MEELSGIFKRLKRRIGGRVPGKDKEGKLDPSTAFHNILGRLKASEENTANRMGDILAEAVNDLKLAYSDLRKEEPSLTVRNFLTKGRSGRRQILFSRGSGLIPGLNWEIGEKTPFSPAVVSGLLAINFSEFNRRLPDPENNPDLPHFGFKFGDDYAKFVEQSAALEGEGESEAGVSLIIRREVPYMQDGEYLGRGVIGGMAWRVPIYTLEKLLD